MNVSVTKEARMAWANQQLPGRVDAEGAARILGFAEHDIRILMATRRLRPLGDPVQNATKWFCAVELLELAMDKKWLDRASKEISKHWRKRKGARSAPQQTLPESDPISEAA